MHPRSKKSFRIGVALVLLTLSVVEMALLTAAGEVTPLLSTQWGQRDLYAQQAPLIDGSHARLGCWSTAIGQILFFHKLRGYGDCHYTCSNGIVIDNTVEGDSYEWCFMPVKLTASSSSEEVRQVSAFLFDVSTVVQKDYGTGTYCLSHSERAAALELYYGVRSYLLVSASSGHDLEPVIIAQLAAGHPCMLHLRTIPSPESVYHAVVIDGYRFEGSDFIVHLSYGAEGYGDGWYGFYGAIGEYDDTTYRRIIVIEPEYDTTPSVFRVRHVGDVLADGTVRAQGFHSCSADVAERVTTNGHAEPGHVLVLDPDHPQEYRLSAQACSSLVAGVVSTEPGVVLGQEGASAKLALLALIGAVPVKVTNEGGPIRSGDLLVTSSTPGHAMRWAGPDPCPCALVGKALEPMTDTHGIILVLLTAH